MPYAPLRPCAHGGCAALVTHGRCPAHARPSARARGYGWAWQQRRTQVLREEPWCRACAKLGRPRLSTEADHIVPKIDGGTDDRDNLQGLCDECHAAKTAGEQPARGRAR